MFDHQKLNICLYALHTYLTLSSSGTSTLKGYNTFRRITQINVCQLQTFWDLSPNSHWQVVKVGFTTQVV